MNSLFKSLADAAHKTAAMWAIVDAISTASPEKKIAIIDDLIEQFGKEKNTIQNIFNLVRSSESIKPGLVGVSKVFAKMCADNSIALI